MPPEASVGAPRALVDAFSTCPDPAFLANRDGAVAYVNPAGLARWPSAAPGTSAELLLPVAYRPALRDAVARMLDSGRGERFEWGEEGFGGARSWYVASVWPHHETGGYACMSMDITERKRVEERLRRSEQLMVDTQGAAHLGTWEWDITEPHATWSDELYRIYGLTRETYTPSYEQYLTKVHPDDRERVIAATNRVFHEHIPYSHDERVFRPDGSLRYLHTWAHPVLDDGGKLVRLVGVCQDITDQKLAEEQIRQLNQDLEKRVAERTHTIEQSMRDLEAFNSMVSHDLRTPLSAIQMGADLLLNEPAGLPERTKDTLSRIQRSVGHMAELIEDLLTLARVGQAAIEHTDVDLSALCHEIVDELRRLAPDRQADISIASGLRCTADPGLMRAALANILGNAWKYSARRPRAEITVGALHLDERLALFVRDNGVGFDMQDKQRLFSPFQRLPNASEFPGTGVGLATVHRIVERHGGRIWAESQLGTGATFYLELPSLRRVG